MDNRFFFRRILYLSIGFGVIWLLLGAFPFFKSIREFSWISLLFFMITTVLVYFLSLSGLKKKKHSSFLYFYFGSLFLRFLLSMLIIVGYYFFVRPDEIFFVVPFFLMYIGYTAVETHSLIRLSNAG